MTAQHPGAWAYTWIKDVVETTIRNHPKDCIFHPNAVANIMAEISEQKFDANQNGQYQLIDALVISIQRQEIYCPHEGIDRREELNGTQSAT